MPVNIWTASLHIQDGEAAEDAPEIGHAERLDNRGQPANLYILAEPDRPGSEQFIGDLVSVVGEDFLEEEGSLTGVLQRALVDWHEKLLDWNRTSLPRDQASYGVSCLILRGDDAYLAQVGPSLAYYRQGDRLLRRRPTTQRATPPLGASDVVVPEFSQLTLGPSDWVLLISSGATGAIGEETIAALHGLRGSDVLAAIYPMLLRLPRVSALVVAFEDEGQTDAAALVEPSPHFAPAELPGPVQDHAVTETDAPHLAPTSPKEDDHEARGEVVSGYVSRLGDALRRLIARDETTVREDAPPIAAPPPVDIEPDVEAQGPPGLADRQRDDEQKAADPPPQPTAEAALPPPDTPPDSPTSAVLDALDSEESAVAEAGREQPSNNPQGDDAADGSADDPAGPPDDPPDDPPDAPIRTDPAAAPSETLSVPPSEPGNSLEYRLVPQSISSPILAGAPFASSGSAVAPPATGLLGGAWPSNPFSPATPPLLASAAEIDASRVSAPLIRLRDHVPSFRRRTLGRRRSRDDSDGGAAAGWRERWGPIVLGLGAMLAVFAVIGGLLLIPEALENSERSRFDGAIIESRRALTAASLTNDPEASRNELTIALSAVGEALVLRPLDDSALALRDELTIALQQINAVVQPADITVVLDAREFLAPPLALATVQIGADTAYLLDESGGRIAALPLAGGELSVIYRAGERYRVLGEFNGPQAAAPVAMQWSADALGARLFILDADGQLFQYTPDSGVDALANPTPEILGSADGVAVDDRQLYLLDVLGGTVWRFPLLDDGNLGPGQAAIERSDLGNAASLIVADDILIGGADGRIRRFSLSAQGTGVELGFPLLNLDRPLLIPASLSIGEQSGLLYAADRGNNRVVIFTPGGEVVAQLREDLLSGVRGVVPDERNRRLYFVTADALITSALPEIIER